MRTYAMSDIHGCIDALCERIAQLDELGFLKDGCPDRLMILGDYVDRGPSSLGVISLVMELEERCPERVTALRGNHDEMLLEWLGVPTTLSAKGSSSSDWDLASGFDPFDDEFDDDLGFGFDGDFAEEPFGSHGGVMDLEYRFKSFRMLDPNLVTMRSFLTPVQFGQLDHGLRRHATMLDAFDDACRAIREAHPEVIRWLQGLRDFHETDRQVFVHAGIDESAGREWVWGTPRETMLGTRGRYETPFYKDVICGHTPTCFICGDESFHDVLRYGGNHYFIDGMTTATGSLPMLVWDSERNAYFSLQLDGTPLAPRALP